MFLSNQVASYLYTEKVLLLHRTICNIKYPYSFIVIFKSIKLVDEINKWLREFQNKVR